MAYMAFLVFFLALLSIVSSQQLPLISQTSQLSLNLNSIIQPAADGTTPTLQATHDKYMMTCFPGQTCTTYNGRGVTGFNRLFSSTGTPQNVWNFGTRVLTAADQTFGYNTVGQPGATATLLGTGDGNKLVSTYPDPVLYNNAPVLPSAYVGVPLQSLPQRIDYIGTTAVLNSVWTNPSSSYTTHLLGANTDGGITANTWVAATATMLMRCNIKQGHEAEIWFQGLVAQGLYSMWGVFNNPSAVPSEPPALGTDFFRSAFGGVGGNNFVAEVDGTAHVRRRIPFCPATLEAMTDPTVTKLLAIDVTFHPTGQLYGGVSGLQKLTSATVPDGIGIVSVSQVFIGIGGSKVGTWPVVV